ncbi:MAG: NAD(P)H-binding protein [Thermoleophilia bacterium]
MKVLLTGPTGFIGGRLLHVLGDRGHQVRCLVRTGESFQPSRPPSREPEVVYADLLQPETLAEALTGMDAAYYLVHSMGGRSLKQTREFAARDRRAAINFVNAADTTGLSRIIYMGGLGETGDNLSEHLASRQEVAQILSSGDAETTVLRAAIVIGAGGASFEMVRHLVERLPVMLTPEWVRTRCQPIAIDNVVEYLAGCLEHPGTAGETYDICGPDILTYREMMLTYARVRGLNRILIPVPGFSPHLSSYWVDLVTPVPRGIVMPLIEGLKNEVVCGDSRIQDIIPIELKSMKEAICDALVEEEDGPGKLTSRQACFLD